MRERLLVLRLPGQSGRRSPLASGLGQHRAAELYERPQRIAQFYDLTREQSPRRPGR